LGIGDPEVLKGLLHFLDNRSGNMVLDKIRPNDTESRLGVDLNIADFKPQIVRVNTVNRGKVKGDPGDGAGVFSQVRICRIRVRISWRSLRNDTLSFIPHPCLVARVLRVVVLAGPRDRPGPSHV